VSAAVTNIAAIVASSDHRDVSLADPILPRRKRRKRKPLAAGIAGNAKGASTPPATLAEIVKTLDATAPPPLKDVATHKWPAPQAPPLPTFIKFADLKAAGIATNYCALRWLVERHGFPKGRWLGANTHVWTVDEVRDWLASRPTERPVE
jgi:hypothetical protein